MGKSLRTTLTIIVVLLIAVSGVGIASAADEPTQPESDSDEIRLENLDTGEVYYIPGEQDIQDADVPSGEYLAEYIKDGERVQEYVQIDSDSSLEQQAQSSDSVDLRLIVENKGSATLASNDTVGIVAGAANTTSTIDTPEPGVNITINVTRPNGTTDSFVRTTGQNGSVHLAYNLSAKPDGEYRVRATAPNVTDDGFGRFYAGPTPVGIFPGIQDGIQTGQSSTLAVLVTEARSPVANATENVTIRYPNGTTVTRQVTTNATGFATFELKPPDNGDYRVSTRGPTFGKRFTAGVAVGSMYVNDRRFGTRITPNNSASVSGNLYRSGLPYADKNVTVRIINETDFSNVTTEAVYNITTDEFGQYNITWSPDSGETGDYEARITTRSGAPIVTSDGRITVREQPTAQPSSNLSVVVDVGEGFRPVVKPGASVNTTIEVRENGTAVPNATVTVGKYYGFRQLPADTTTTLTTNASGIVTQTVTVPSSAPDGSELEVEALVTHNGSSATGIDGAELQRYVIRKQRPGRIASGATLNYTLSAVDAETGDPVPGVPVTLIGETHDTVGDIFAPRAAETQSDGSVTIKIPVPDRAKRSIHLGDQAPYEEVNGYPYLRIDDFDVSVNGINQSEYTAGTSLGFDYSTTSSENVSAIGLAYSFDEVDAKLLFDAKLSEGATASLDIPTSVPDGTRYTVRIRAVSESGETGNGFDSFRVNNTGPDPDGDGTPATDPDGDGEYEDINGDGSFDINDVGEFFDTYTNTDDDRLDFTGDGSVNINDVGELFDQV